MMAQRGEDRSKFRTVVDFLAKRIYNGDLVSGQRFYSRQEICDEFGLSPVTAFKVQRALKDLELIVSAPGQGFFVNVLRTATLEPAQTLRRVRAIGSPTAIGPGTKVGERIMAGVAEACEAHHLAFEIEYVDVLARRGNAINNRRHLASDEGLALFLGASLLPEVVSLLLTPGARVSLINESFPGQPSVLLDNRHCVRSLLDELERRGCRRLLRAGFVNNATPHINESEQFEAFEEFCEARKLAYRIDCSGSYPELVRQAKEFGADALLFPDDDSAAHFNAHFQTGVDLPAVGCYGVLTTEAPFPGLLSYRADFEEMGRAAVRQLLQRTSPFQAVRNVRVPGRIQITE